MFNTTASFSAGHIYQNIPCWGENQFFSFSHGYNPRLVLRLQKNDLLLKRTIGIKLSNDINQGWELFLTEQNKLILSRTNYNLSKNTLVVTTTQINSSIPILGITPNSSSSKKQLVTKEYVDILKQLIEDNKQLIEDNKEKLNTLFNYFADIDLNLSTIQTTIETTNSTITNNQNDIFQLQEHFTTLENSVTTISNQITTLENSVATISNQQITPGSILQSTLPPETYTQNPTNLQTLKTEGQSATFVPLTWDAIACHPDTGVFLIGASNETGALAYSSDNGITWQLIALQHDFTTQGVVISPRQNGWIIFERNSNKYLLLDMDFKITGSGASTYWDSINNAIYIPREKCVYATTNDSSVIMLSANNQLTKLVYRTYFGADSSLWVSYHKLLNKIIVIKSDFSKILILIPGVSQVNDAVQARISPPTSIRPSGVAYLSGSQSSHSSNFYIGTYNSYPCVLDLLTSDLSFVNISATSSFSTSYRNIFCAPHIYSDTIVTFDAMAQGGALLIDGKTKIFTGIALSDVLIDNVARGGEGRTYAYSPQTGRTIFLTNTNNILYY